jgi:hypothetical protein
MKSVCPSLTSNSVITSVVATPPPLRVQRSGALAAFGSVGSPVTFEYWRVIASLLFTMGVLCAFSRLTAIAGSSPISSDSVTSLLAIDPNLAVIDRGQDFAVFRRVLPSGSAQSPSVTNQFTLLENNLHYFANGSWNISQDLIESFPDGAVARYGPDQAVFSSDLNTPAVFDIATSDGKRLQGGFRGIQLIDLSSGKSVVIAAIKKSAPGTLLPPNRIVYEDCTDGLKCDLLLGNYSGPNRSR